ncbi:MAG: Gfo/Idh/MocA family oxidoreductase [Pseudomonadota bacterium]
MSASLRVGLIGAGVFGGYHANKIADASDVSFSGIHDPDPARASTLATKHNCSVWAEANVLFENSDAVIVATPAISHSQLAGGALQAGCHVLVEKPLALTAFAASELVDMATKADLTLQVGHQERMVCQALGLFDIDETPTSLFATREGLPPQNGRNLDVSVVWDLMIHDLDLAHCLTGPGREVLSGDGIVGISGSLDSCEANLLMSGCRAQLVASRTAERQKRHLTLKYSSGEISVDFVERTVKNTTAYALNSDFAVKVPDPLAAADFAFFDACLGRRPCLIPGAQAAWAVATAERIEQLATQELGVALG